MAHEQCCAITKNGVRCKRMHRWTFPNVISGTGIGKDDWKYGRRVHLCRQHGDRYFDTKKPMKVIEGGYLQPFNRYGHGNFVVDRIIDWTNPEAKMPEYWKQKE